MWIEKDSQGNISRHFGPDVTTLPAGYDPAEWEWTDEAIVEIDSRLYLASQAPAPSFEQQEAAITAAVQARLDDFAKTRGYDSTLACITYANSTHPQFQLEGRYMLTARDETWVAAILVLSQAAMGARPMPSVEDFLAELPELIWPGVAVEEAEAEA